MMKTVSVPLDGKAKRRALAEPGWIKTPSVREGGRPYFWVRHSGEGRERRRETIIWDRHLKRWVRSWEILPAAGGAA